ncbi:MAG: alpha/beta fold hydrolase [Dehalococcoidia bacterium]
MTTFVFVHGSWHGGWCWQRVARLLRQRGHDVYTPTLTGLGERSHLVSPESGLNLHIQDIRQVLEYEDLQDVVLTGHSYGGMVITGVAEESWERIAHLVYLDAYVPQDGQSEFDLRPDLRERRERLAAAGEQGWLVPSPDPASWGITDAADVAWVGSRLTPMPLLTYQESVQTPAGRPQQLPRTFIVCTGGRNTFYATAQEARAEGWGYYELETGHDAMITMPAELTEILLQLATKG